MKRHVLDICIQKQGKETVFFLKDLNDVLHETSLDTIVEQIVEFAVELVYFETIEQENILLSGYLVVKNKKSITKHLKKVAKAQLIW